MSKWFAISAIGAAMLIGGCKSCHKDKKATTMDSTMKMSADGKTCTSCSKAK